MLSIRLPSYISCLTRQSINQSIHINLSAGAQNITGAYIIMLIYLFIISRALQGHSTDVQYNLTQNIFSSYIILTNFCLNVSTQLD